MGCEFGAVWFASSNLCNCLYNSGGSGLSQSDASATGWSDSSVNVGSSSSSDVRSAPCVSFVLPQVVAEVAVS